MSDNNNNNNDEYEKVCYVCRRTESKAGKMISMPGGLYVCPDCMQKTFDAINNNDIDYNELMKGIPILIKIRMTKKIIKIRKKKSLILKSFLHHMKSSVCLMSML